MTADGHPETAAEIQDVAHSREWQVAVMDLKSYRRQGSLQLLEVHLEDMRARFGKLLVEGLLEWLAD